MNENTNDSDAISFDFGEFGSAKVEEMKEFESVHAIYPTEVCK